MKSLSRIFRCCFLSLLCACLFSLAQPTATASASQVQDERTKILAEIEQLKQRMGQSSNDPLLYYKLSGLYQQLFQWQEAATALERATQIKPDFAAAYYDLGWCYAALSKYAEALGAHEQALVHASNSLSSSSSLLFDQTKLPRGPSNAEAQLAIGWDYALMKQYDEAIAGYQKALELDPKFEDALYEIGRVYLAQGRKDEVMEIAAKLSIQLKEWLLKEMSLTKPAANKLIVVAVPPAESGQRESPAVPAESGKTGTLVMSASLRPKILYKEKAKYTEGARSNRIRGTVVLNLVFFADGHIGDFRVIRGLPYGLTATALMASEKIRFEPALKDGQPVSVRGNIEFNFTLY